MLIVGDHNIVLWGDAGDLHVEPSCPAASPRGAWREYPIQALEVACRVCSVRRLSVQYVASTPQIAAARLATASDVIVEATVAAVAGDVSRLLEANYALVIAATAARELGVDSPFRTARRTLSELRDLHQEAFELELARRALTASPRAAVTMPTGEHNRTVWRAVRWAVRHGIDPAAATAHLNVTSSDVDQYLAELERTARSVCATERHLLLAAADSLPTGSLTEIIAGSGALGDLLGEAAAVVLPAGVVDLLSTPYPGVHVADAGLVDAASVSPELLRMVAHLWRGDVGVITDAAAAHAVARSLLS